MQRFARWGKWASLFTWLLLTHIIFAQQPSTLSGSDQTLIPTKPGPPPKAVFKEMRHAFGEVQRGESVSHIFIVKNEGEGPLAITNVAPG
ncbi:MAG: DUF1573 domain-containing protein [Acidobacteria bacterium]|nr:DUF1573 domain-containing protein [Acidobacteriota bacterium]MBI3658428.1 DUF1573 domain-containing protein [Acidobacteriota bacterium]